MRDPMARLHLIGERSEQLFVRGQGSWLWDADGQAYLDFYQGHGSNALGHSPKRLLEAMTRQGELLINPGMRQCNRGQLKLASRLCQATGSERVAFCADAAHANELAVNLALRWAQVNKPNAQRVILSQGHALLTNRGLRSAVDEVPFNDLDALDAALNEHCACLLLQPIEPRSMQPASLEYLQGAQRLCRERGVLLILDETACGMGRSGALLSEELYGVRADLLTLGSSLAGGLPLAAVLARGGVCADEHKPMDELAGEALLTAAGVAVLSAVLEGGFLEHVQSVAAHLREGLTRLARRLGHGPVRGHGLLLGLALNGQNAHQVVEHAQREGLLLSAASDDCLCLSPALSVSHASVEQMLRRLERALARAEQFSAEVA